MAQAAEHSADQQQQQPAVAGAEGPSTSEPPPAVETVVPLSELVIDFDVRLWNFFIFVVVLLHLTTYHTFALHPLSIAVFVQIQQAISRTCNEMIPLCMRLMDLGSDLVFSTSDLVIGVIDSCDPTWKKEQLVRKVMCLEVGSWWHLLIF